jgi:amino acid transporter
MSDRAKAKPGRKSGDRRVPIERPNARYFRYDAPGVFTAKLAAEEPATPFGRALGRVRHVLFGRPLASEAEITERLPKWKALPIFSSDAMSSVAYGPEAAMYTLLAAGTIAFAWLMPIMAVVLVVLVLITLSYRQTIKAYPNGGGSYIVARANLGELPGLVAAAALLTDYVLTVSVSVSAGVFNLASAFPPLQPVYVPLIVAAILGVMLVNLRGIRESGSILAWPTYLFLGSTLLVIAIGLARVLLSNPPHVSGVSAYPVPLEGLGILLVMRAFANGCSALTGTEAVANGVPAFKPPEASNARTTMLMMSILLGVMLIGIAYLAVISGALPSAQLESVMSQVGRATVGLSPLYYLLQISTMGVLVIAAQTSFADFPRVGAILAKDGYFPRQFAFRGERLAFNSGIVVLAILSVGLVIIFGGHVEALIPLYALGVYTAFTLSQTGMVHHWLTERSPGWGRSAVLNGLGAVATGVVVIVFAIAKFSEGAWIIIVVVPILVGLMLFVHREYAAESQGLAVRVDVHIPQPHRAQYVVVAAPSFSRAVIQAIRVAQTMSPDVEVVHVTADPDDGERFLERAAAQLEGARVVIVESPYRTLVNPFIRYLETTRSEHAGDVTVVLIPEYVPRHWWDRLLYNQNAHRIRDGLIGRRDIVVLDVPYRREERAKRSDRA